MKDLIICNILSLVLIPVLPIVVQLKSQVNNGAFKRVRIKHLSFLFRDLDGMPVNVEGIALPIFISQLIGYLLFFLLGVLDLLLYFMSPSLFKTMTFIICFVLYAEVICLVVFDMVLLKMSRPKQYFKRDKGKNNRVIMRFIPFEAPFIYTGQPCLKYNTIYSDPHCYSDDVLQFGDWRQELDVDSRSKTAVAFSAIFSPKRIKETPLNIPNFIDARIVIEGLKNTKKPMRIYYDKCSGWFCFGNKDSGGQGYRFATDTIAVISNGQMEAIFIHPISKKK